MKKHIIFDLDGTLLDTIKDITNSLNEVLIAYGYKTVSVEDCKKMVGDSFILLIQRAIYPQVLKEDKLFDFFTKLNTNYQNSKKENTDLYTGIKDIIKYLDSKDISYSVATNKDQQAAEELIERIMKFSKPFMIKGIDPVKKIRKPDESFVENIYVKLRQKLDLTKEDILFVGDSQTDFLTAKNGKVDFMWVGWGFRTKEDMKDYDIKYQADNQEQAFEIIKNITK